MSKRNLGKELFGLVERDQGYSFISDAIDTKTDDAKGVRNEQALCFHNNLWWTNCGADAMYVYYNPTHWRMR